MKIRHFVWAASQGFKMNAFFLPALVLLMAYHSSCHANARYDAWQAQHPFIQTAWISRELSLSSEPEYEYFLGSGLNTFWDGVRSGSMYWKHTESRGLPTLVMSYGSAEPDLDGFIKDFSEARKTHRNIVGIALGDEVKSSLGQGGLRHMRAVRDWIAGNEDPDISGLITFSSVPTAEFSSDNKAILDYWNETYEQIRPDAWMAQIYPVGGGTLTPDYYSTLEWYFNWAKEKDVAMWCWLDTWSSSKEGVPSESELRLQRFTSLAYGMRGFGDFLWHADGDQPSIRGAGYWDDSGQPTDIYRHLSVINREISNIAKSLIRLTPVRAYHMDGVDAGLIRRWSDNDSDLPGWMQRTWGLANVSAPSSKNRLLVGFFRDAAGQEYFMVVNKDFGKEKTGADLATDVTLTFHPGVKAIQRLRRSDGKVETIPVKDNYIFSLPGGTGDLFKFDTGKPFAGVNDLTLPRLTHSEPAQGGILCKVSGNSISLSFDCDASSVIAEIREIDSRGVESGSDLAECFVRTLSSDKRTIIYREDGRALKNNTNYRVELHWADSRPLDIRTVRGDVDGDGQVSVADSAALAAVVGGAVPLDCADLDSDGRVDATDTRIFGQIANREPFEWIEDFEEYPVGPLAGNGRWMDVESLPSSVGLKSWVVKGLLVADRSELPENRRKVGGSNSMEYYGNETLFHDNGGFGYSGMLRCGCIIHEGTTGFQNPIFWIWNSKDTAGELGGIGVEYTIGSVIVRGARGAKLTGEQSTAVESGAGKRFAVDITINFDASMIVWQCRDVDSDKLYGPFECHYSGSLEGLDTIGLYVRGDGALMDHVSVRNF